MKASSKRLKLACILGFGVAAIVGVFFRKELKSVTKLSISFIGLIQSSSWSENKDPRPLLPGYLVAHAGGGVKGLAYTNSLDALDSNYRKGVRVFEIDFESTLEDSIVCIHDWGVTWSRLHTGAAGIGRQTYKAFMETPMLAGLRPMDKGMLIEWLRMHPDAFVVTDVKVRNIPVLRRLAQAADVRMQIIPQIYSFREFGPVKALGFEKLFLTLYAIETTDWMVLQFTKSHNIAAVVCPPWRATGKQFALRLTKSGVPVYVHTINDHIQFEKLRSQGVAGVIPTS